ncbi:serine/threonine-protein kinase [Parafrankia sp. BMG5.11]|uniref:serine/threonine-protein kinase n=1 Tax=Parafrankia sp. BMG5.11 TaxID=222540 RepID=UPI001039D094|nr:serine/threonine-protein kinase [Parafrankia sp. BMG5.11]TCJ36439.1 serine/threonine protein kinase [Parafrankia sp. BMG5.11]
MRKLGARYVLHELLGQGTAGQVWRGAHVPDGEPVAIKVLRPELAHDPEIVDRFLREWDLLVELDSPDLVRVRDLIREPDTPLAIVMDLVEGIDLRAHLDQSGPRPVTEAVNLVVGLLWALDSVHAAGIIHRDVKPENVLIDTSDPRRPYVRLTDFGVARMVHTPTRASLTGPIGTPLYMAPELTTDAPPTPAVDIYAAGIVLYELIAGSPPFDEAHPADMVRAHREDQPLPIQGVPPALWDVLSSMLAKSPRQRPASAADAAEDLIEALENDRDRDDPDFDSDDQLDLDNRRPDNRDREFDDRSAGQRGRGAVPEPRRDAPGKREAAFDAAQTRIGSAADWAEDERGRQPAAAGRRLAGAGAAVAATSVAGAGGPTGDWNDAEHTQIAGMPPVRPDWNDAEHTQIAGMPPVRADWSDDDTGGRPAVRVPARSTGSASDRNTVISAIPANKQPAPGSSGSSGGPGGPGGRSAGDRRRRSRIAAGAGLVVALVAGAGGWALAAAGDSESALTADGGSQVVADPSITATLPGGAPMPPGMDPGTVPTSSIAGTTPHPSTSPKPGQSATPGPATPTQPGQTTAPPDASAAPTPTPTAKEATVPNVVGQSQTAATNTLTGKGFTNVTATEVCQKGKNGGVVLDQGPNAGSVVPVTTKVTLTVQATNCVEVPAVANQTLAAARNVLIGAGLGVLDGNGGCQNGPGTTAAGTNPAAGTMMRKGDSVWLEPTCAKPPPTTPAAAK